MVSWTTALIWCLIALIFVCVLICLVAAMIESDRANKRDWRKFEARAERNAFRDAKGVTKP